MSQGNIKLYTLKEAAEILRISYRVLYDMCVNNEIEHSKIRSKYVISEEQIRAYLDGVTVIQKND